ncbi:MAG: c-type cytochrome [Acidobacteria bacterium]|nr:c-type cytochrome [Acidobacteriota bacterium]
MSNSSSTWVAALVVSGVLGLTALAATWFVMRDRARNDLGGVQAEATAEYGRRLIAQTNLLIGPDHPDPEMRYTGNRLNCGSCHLQSGEMPGQLSLTETYQKYPRYSGRDGREADLKDRIDGCMERSMNGRVLPRDSVELNAMVAYIQALSEQTAAMPAAARIVDEPSPFRTPDRAASPDAGRVVYDAKCALCHGRDGLGLLASADPRRGYIFPPLWGDDAYNNGAGMTRVITASRFIKAKMPFGKPDLTDDQAYDVAAFINAQPRPLMSQDRLNLDYPDKSTKPVDSPYPPFGDPFSVEQHRLGPFGPIEAFYKKQQ